MLGKEELKNFFDNSGDSEKEDVRYREKKIEEFSTLWKWINIIISLILIIVLALNHYRPLQEIILSLKDILDSIRNTSS